jgi:hypothetical protein
LVHAEPDTRPNPTFYHPDFALVLVASRRTLALETSAWTRLARAMHVILAVDPSAPHDVIVRARTVVDLVPHAASACFAIGSHGELVRAALAEAVASGARWVALVSDGLVPEPAEILRLARKLRSGYDLLVAAAPSADDSRVDRLAVGALSDLLDSRLCSGRPVLAMARVSQLLVAALSEPFQSAQHAGLELAGRLTLGTGEYVGVDPESIVRAELSAPAPAPPVDFLRAADAIWTLRDRLERWRHRRDALRTIVGPE